MKSVISIICLVFFAACGSAPRPVAENSNAAVPASNDRPQTVIAHSLENGTPPAANSGDKSHWTQGGTAIDTTALDAAIAKAEKGSDKKALAAAYLKRATALTQAQQYASALGDYRRTVKNDPSNGEAQQWIMQITSIYNSMNREAPKEGEEPPPLKKQ